MKRKCQIFLLFALVSLVTTSWAQSGYTVKASRFTIDGSSNVHDWQSKVTGITGTADLNIENGAFKGIRQLSVTIPVKGIKSPKGSIMDNKTYDALKQEDYPNITYKLVKVNSVTQKGGAYEVSTTGNLTIAGVTKSVDITVTAKDLGNNAWQFEGSKPLKMTDFKISPPTALMGTMKTGDDVTIKFAVTVEKAAGS